MPARVGFLNLKTRWWTSVCPDHDIRWLGDIHKEWVFARLDQLEHNLTEHPFTMTWEEVVYGTEPIGMP